MFLAVVFIILGLFLLLNAMGIIVGTNFWGLFWAIIFLAIGIKMLMRQGRCPICSGYWWTGKIQDKMHGHCCDHEHEHQENKQ